MKKRERTAQMSIYEEEDVFFLLQEMRETLRMAYQFRDDPKYATLSCVTIETLMQEIGAIIEFLDAHKMTPKTSMKKEKTMARIGNIRKRADKNRLIYDLVELLYDCAGDVQSTIDGYLLRIEDILGVLENEMDDDEYKELLDAVQDIRNYDFEDTPIGIGSRIEDIFEDYMWSVEL